MLKPTNSAAISQFRWQVSKQASLFVFGTGHTEKADDDSTN